MNFTETHLKGAYIIDINRLEDERGFFGRSYCQKEFDQYGLNTNIVQTNLAYTKKKATIRGLHMQLAPYGETKLIRCTKGAIYDVIVDLRKDSETFKQWFGVELRADSFRMLYIPEGFAHGYLTLENNTDTTYHVTQFYNGGYEIGVRWDDSAFNIQWPINPEIISDKDKNFADFSEDKAFINNL